VKENYIFTPNEIAQNLRIINLFEKFDFDGSGALDPDELAPLYQSMGIFLGEPEIALLYNDPNVKFTLKEFEKITKDKERLKIYRE
jgi:Ca2+-binding EF-hand superfamily protein